MSATVLLPTLRELAAATVPLTGAPDDFRGVLDLAAGRSYVLIGEASHGTHEFYRIRAELTKRLIRDHGFTAVAIEGDWPDAYRVNRWVRGVGEDRDSEESLRGFTRFPQWMWRNADVVDFVGWLRSWNDANPNRAVGFYGLDLYSLHASIEAVLSYLRKVDPPAAQRAARRYACFDHFGGGPQEYGYAAAIEGAPSCEAEVVKQLVDLRANAREYSSRDGRIAADDLFYAHQNAMVVVNAERYYRVMYSGGATSWNLRDHHMHETLQALTAFLRSQKRDARVVVWAHNSHLGDARATQMSRRREWNLGQLVRESRGDEALLVGFTTYDGTVTAGSDWDAPVERKRVRPALPESYEALFHDIGHPAFYLDLGADAAVREMLDQPRLERAIGVIYMPETERRSHYFLAHLPSQFDAVFHYDRTRAVEPLERTPQWTHGETELPETYPTAL